MFKQRIIQIIGSLALLVAVTGSLGMATDRLTATALAQACTTGSSTGGGCLEVVKC